MKSRATINVLCLVSSLLIPAVYACPHVVTANAGNDRTVCVGNTVSGGSASCDLCSISYSDSSWSAPGGSPSSGLGVGYSCTYNTPGYKTITINAECNSGYTDSDSVTITVVGVGSVTTSETLVCVDQNVTFTAVSTPSNKPMNCLEWQARWKYPESQTWGGWSAAGSANPMIVSSASPGYMQYRARNGTADTWKESSEVTIVDVNSIEIQVADWDDVTGETIVLLKGTKYQFRAIPSPSGASWPSNSPIWSGIAQGTGPTIDVTFDSTGTKTLNAKCCCDDGKTVTIEVMEPIVYQVGFSGDHTLYKTPVADQGWGDGDYAITDPVYVLYAAKNEPVCVTKNSSSVSLTDVKLSAHYNAPPLSYPATITVDAGGIEEWNESSGVNISGFYSDSISLSITGNIINEVKKYDGTFQIDWKYKVPSGTDTWYTIGSTSHTMYVTYGTPDPGGSELTEQRINELCYWANGAYDPKSVADGIHSNLSLPFGSEETKLSDDWDLMCDTCDKEGECDEHARFMVRAIKLLGSTGEDYLTMASTDTDVEDLESVTAMDVTFYLLFDFDNNGVVDNRFEGSVFSGNHCYAVSPKLNANSKCELLRKVGPDGYGATQRWAEYRNDDFWNGALTGLQVPGTVSYPSCQ